MTPFLALITPIGGSPPSGPPLGTWGGSSPGVMPQPYPDQSLPRPPLGIWGGGGVGNYPDAGFPGPQPGRPPGIWGGPWFPPVIWDPNRPTNPIVNPGDPDNPAAGQPQPPRVEWKTAWSPSTGWVVIGVPVGEHVTPSSEE